MPKRLWRSSLFALLAAPLFLVILFLCVMNADTIKLVWWPIAPALELPMFSLILAVFALGFIAGGALTWLDKK